MDVAERLPGVHLAELESRTVFGATGYTVRCLGCGDKSKCYESRGAALKWNARHAGERHGVSV